MHQKFYLKQFYFSFDKNLEFLSNKLVGRVKIYIVEIERRLRSLHQVIKTRMDQKCDFELLFSFDSNLQFLWKQLVWKLRIAIELSGLLICVNNRSQLIVSEITGCIHAYTKIILIIPYQKVGVRTIASSSESITPSCR